MDQYNYIENILKGSRDGRMLIENDGLRKDDSIELAITF